MSVKIIVDSTADLVPTVKERCTVVPLTVHFGEEEYIDGVTITHKQFYEKLVESDTLRTTAIGSVIGTHAGPGAVAVAFFAKGNAADL